MTSRVPFGPDESRRYTFGLAMEAVLNEHISLNVNPLYRRTGERFGLVPGTNLIFPNPETVQILENTGRVRSHSLQLPVIGTYTFREATRFWRPFAGAGFAFQTSWQTVQNRVILRDSSLDTLQVFDSTENRRTPVDAGAVFSAGLSLKRGRIRYVPEFRFTRWGRPDTSHNRSQAEVLFSIRF